MSTLSYAGNSYNRASGTRDSFGRLSDRLVSEGHPHMAVVSGDRETWEQEQIFLARYRAQASGGGPFNDVRWYKGVRYVRVSSAGTVAVPTTSTHESRRSNDLAWPYNTVLTTAHARAVQLAPEYGIVCDGLNFGEAWHFTNRGSLGVIGSPAGGGSTQFEEDDMAEEASVQEAIRIGNVNNQRIEESIRIANVNYTLLNALLAAAADDATEASVQEAIRIGNVNYVLAREIVAKPSAVIDPAKLGEALGLALTPEQIAAAVDGALAPRFAELHSIPADAADELAKRLAG